MKLEKNIPTLFTFFRICLIPVFILVYYMPSTGKALACIIFILAAMTDWLDGYLARKLMQTSAFGQFLDPVADKLLVVVALVMIVSEYQSMFITLPAAIIIGREIAVSALREWMSQLGKRVKISVIYVAKVKTVMQLISLTLLILYTPNYHSYYVFYIGSGLLIISAMLTIWSMLVYLKSAWPDLTLGQNQ